VYYACSLSFLFARLAGIQSPFVAGVLLEVVASACLCAPVCIVVSGSVRGLYFMRLLTVWCRLKDTNAKTVLRWMRVVNIIDAMLIILVGILSLISLEGVLLFHSVLVGIYTIIFGLMLVCCF